MCYFFRDSSVVEQLAVNQLVGGSNPSRGADNFCESDRLTFA